MTGTRTVLCSAAAICVLLASPALAQHDEHEQGERAGAQAATPTTYADGIKVIRAQLDKIGRLIKAGELEEVHAETAVIRDMAKKLARFAMNKDSGVPRKAIRQINLTARELAAKFGPIDEAGDSGDSAGVKKIYDEMVALYTTLKEYAPPAAYVCSMYHENAEVYSSPGKCSICGMGLVAVQDDGYTVDVEPDAARITPGEAVSLAFTVRNAKGRIVQNLSEMHEARLHVQVVSRDLSRYAHIRPQRQSGGTYGQTFTFPTAGDYVLFNVFKPTGTHPQVVPVSLTVPGQSPTATGLVVDTDAAKTIDGYTVSLDTGGPVSVGRMATFAYSISSNGTPVTDLEPLAGTAGHLSIFSEGAGFLVPAHPADHTKRGEHGQQNGGDMSGMNMNMKMDHAEKPAPPSTGPVVRFNAKFEAPGLYKAWAQFKREGKVFTVPFVISVAEADNRSDEQADDDHDADDDH